MPAGTVILDYAHIPGHTVCSSLCAIGWAIHIKIRWRRKSKDKESSNSSSKKAKESDAGTSRPPPQLKKAKGKAVPEPASTGYLDGIDLPSSSDSEEETQTVERTEKHLDVSQQVQQAACVVDKVAQCHACVGLQQPYQADSASSLYY